MGDVTRLADPGHQLLDQAFDGLRKKTTCGVLLRCVPNAPRRILHEVPTLSATGQVTPRGSRRGATAATKEHGSEPRARVRYASFPSGVRFSSRGLAELSPGSSITDGIGRGYLTSRDWPGAPVTS